MSSFSPALGTDQAAEKAARIAIVVSNIDIYRLESTFSYLADFGLTFNNSQMASMLGRLSTLSDANPYSLSSNDFRKGLDRILLGISSADILERAILSKTKYDEILERYLARYILLECPGLDASRVARHLVGIIGSEKQDPKILLPFVLILGSETRTELAESLVQCYQKLASDKWKNAPAFVEVILKLDSAGFEKKIADALLSQLERFPPKSSEEATAALLALLPTIPESKITPLTDSTKPLLGVNYGWTLCMRPELLNRDRLFLVAKLVIASSPRSMHSGFYPELKRLTDEQATELGRKIVAQIEADVKEGGPELAYALEALSPKITTSEKQKLADRCVALLESKAGRVAHLNRAISILSPSESTRARALKKYAILLHDETIKQPNAWVDVIDDIAALEPSPDSEAAQLARAKALPYLGEFSFWAAKRVTSFTKLHPTQAEARKASDVIMAAMRKDNIPGDNLTYTRTLVAIDASPEHLATCLELLWTKLKQDTYLSQPESVISAISLIGRPRLAEALEIALESGVGNNAGPLDSLPKLVSYVHLLEEDEQLRLLKLLRRGLTNAKTEDSAKHLVDFLVIFDKIPLQNLMDFLKLPAVTGQNENPVLDAVEQRVAAKWTSSLGKLRSLVTVAGK